MPVIMEEKNKTISTLAEVAEKVDALSMDCHDVLVPVERIAFESLERMYIGSTSHHIRPIAQMEIAYRLGIPLHYLRKCPQSLQCDNMNHWILKERNEELFIRFDGEDVRAIFTPKYKPVDNFEIMERLDSLGYGPDTKVQARIDKEFMLLNIPDTEKTFEIGKGDTMTPGISVSNSEVGLSSVTVAAYILRLICTNGMIGTSEVTNKYRHVSRRILDELPDALSSVSNEITNQKRQLKFSMESPVSDPMATMERFNRQFALGKEERVAVDWAWPMEMGPAMFHIIQTYTRASQSKDLTAEESYKLQRVGGRILSMVN